MVDKPDIVKRLRKEEKLGKFQSKVHSVYEKLKTPMKISDDASAVKAEGTMRVDNISKAKLEEELAESQRHFQTLFNTMTDPVAIVDEGGIFLEVTDKVVEFTGFKKEELLGRNFLRTKIVTNKSKAIMVKNLAKRMAGMKLAPYEMEVLTKDGRKLPYELNASKIVYKGKPADMVVFRDISKRKQVKKKLQKAYDDVERKVEERTVEISEKNKQLQKEIVMRKQSEEELKGKIDELELFNEVTVNREYKMVELKKEVNELREQLGEKPRYDVEEEVINEVK